jgi:hypothetical protein
MDLKLKGSDNFKALSPKPDTYWMPLMFSVSVSWRTATMDDALKIPCLLTKPENWRFERKERWFLLPTSISPLVVV